MPPDEAAVLSDRDAADIDAHLRQMQASSRLRRWQIFFRSRRGTLPRDIVARLDVLDIVGDQWLFEILLQLCPRLRIDAKERQLG